MSQNTSNAVLLDPVNSMDSVEASVTNVTTANTDASVISLSDFIANFGDGLLEAVRTQNPPVYDGTANLSRESILQGLKRQAFVAQREVVQAVTRLLVDQGDPAAIINAEMGTGKTMMAIAAAAIMHAEGYQRTLVISPPHLVYKWRREIKDTVPGARVWILNGPDTLKKLLQIRSMRAVPTVPEFFVLGRVRMRMGFHWRPSFMVRRFIECDDLGAPQRLSYAACASCGTLISNQSDDGEVIPLSVTMAAVVLNEKRQACRNCGSALWTLMRQGHAARSRRDMLLSALQQLPTIGQKTAERLIVSFGEKLLSDMLEDNLFEFINLMDENGDLVFSDRQAQRMERSLSSFEFSYGQGGYQPTEFIKRQLPQGFFGLLVVDEGHEYKNEGSAQGQAMGVLARKCKKTLLLTGTLMGGYADDLFYLLWRLHPKAMIEDGFKFNARGSLSAASMGFMREHGVLKDVYKESDSQSHRTAAGKSTTCRTSKGPGFGPKGIMRYVLPCTAFLKLKDIGGNVLPPYAEFFAEVAMTEEQEAAYRNLSNILSAELRQSLRTGDTTLLGVVLNVLLAWPDCAFRDEIVRHPRKNQQLAYQRALFGEGDVMPKEQSVLDLCKREKAKGRRTLVYSVYTGMRDTTARMKALLDSHGFKTAVLRASVDAVKREDWVAEQVDRGIDVLICNPELVKTGLDLLEFPTIAFMQSGFNVYTVQQAARRSWRIGQKLPVEVHYFGYAGSAQMSCLQLMAQKIAVSQSTSGDMPDSGLDVLNQSGDSMEVALAKRLVR